MADAMPWEMNWEVVSAEANPQVQEEKIAPAEQEPEDGPWNMEWDVVNEPPAQSGGSGILSRFDTNINQETISRLIEIESGGKVDAQAPTSSARGAAQFIDTTWLAMVERYRPELSEELSEDDVLALRDDPGMAIEMATRLAEENVAALEKAGLPTDDGAIYLAHFAGISTAKRVLKASDDTPAESVFSKGQVKANKSIIQGKTVGQVKAWARRKMEKAGGKGHVERLLGGGQ